MRTIIYLFLSAFFTIQLNAQSCTTPTSKAYLDINNVKALVTNGGGMWFDQDSTKGTYEILSLDFNQGFSAGIVVSGVKTQGGNLYFAGTRYQQGDGDFWAGPIVDINNPMTFQECDLWNRHFKLNKIEIDNFATTNFPIDISNVPLTIKEWPAKGNSYMQNLGMTLLNDYAPFNDVNGNSIYDPQNGDLPIIKGDQAIYWIINDYEGQIQTDFSNEKLGLEIQIMAYAFDQNNDIANATFYDYKVINRSNKSYKDFYFSKYIDINNVNAIEDYIGVDSINRYVYSYGLSATCQDFTNCKPIILSSFVCASNDNRLSSCYIQSNSQTIGGIIFNRNLQIGLEYNGAEIDDFPNNGNPPDCIPSSMPDDKRYMMNSGPHNFYIGEELEFTLMVATSLEQYVGCPDRDSLITPFYQNVSQLYYNETSCGFPKTITSINTIESLNVQVYPNPSNGDNIVIDNLPNKNISIELINALGQVLIKQESQMQTKLTITNQQKGIYFLRLFDTSNDTQYLKKISFND